MIDKTIYFDYYKRLNSIFRLFKRLASNSRDVLFALNFIRIIYFLSFWYVIDLNFLFNSTYHCLFYPTK